MQTDQEEQRATVWEFLEKENPHAPEAQALYSWGLNCDPSGNPFLMFLDVIGWGEEYCGSRMTPDDWEYGFLELDYFADALKEYTNDPERVYRWVEELMQTEGV